MKFQTLIGIAVCGLAMIFATGCSTPGGGTAVNTPAITQQGVTLLVQGGLMAYPQYTPAVQAAGAVICIAAGSTNTTPTQITAALSGISTNAQVGLIINGVMLLYETAFNSLVSTNQQAAAQPYLQAVCNGINAAVPSPVLGAKRLSAVKGDWSQVPFKR
jgi:hypothetical protein